VNLDGIANLSQSPPGIAGIERNLFDPQAVIAIHQGSGGLVRKENRLARGGLIAAAAQKSDVVPAGHIRLTATEIF